MQGGWLMPKPQKRHRLVTNERTSNLISAFVYREAFEEKRAPMWPLFPVPPMLPGIRYLLR